MATTQNHQIQRSLEPPYHQPDFSPKRDWLPDISWLALFFLQSFRLRCCFWSILHWRLGPSCKTMFSRFLAFGYKRIKLYMSNICWYRRSLWQQVHVCKNHEWIDSNDYFHVPPIQTGLMKCHSPGLFSCKAYQHLISGDIFGFPANHGHFTPTIFLSTISKGAPPSPA